MFKNFDRQSVKKNYVRFCDRSVTIGQSFVTDCDRSVTNPGKMTLPVSLSLSLSRDHRVVCPKLQYLPHSLSLSLDWHFKKVLIFPFNFNNPTPPSTTTHRHLLCFAAVVGEKTGGKIERRGKDGSGVELRISEPP